MLERSTGKLAALAVLAAAGLWPAAAVGHGGTTIAEGQSRGLTILVQGSDAATAGGQPGVDVATTLAGPGSGAGSLVSYYVRPRGGKTFRVNTERDEGGVHHATISTANRGDWRAWDVSAIVVPKGGKRLRVTNASGNAPGPDPARVRPEPAPATEADPATSPEPSALPTTTTPAPAEEPVDDISGESDGAPAWVIPSLAVVLVLGLLGLAVTRRGRDGSGDAPDDWDDAA